MDILLSDLHYISLDTFGRIYFTVQDILSLVIISILNSDYLHDLIKLYSVWIN